MQCVFCGKTETSQISCPQGHYVCNACHGRSAIEFMRQYLVPSTEKDPQVMAELIMSHPSVPMHGPEHHGLVAGVLVAAVRNSGYSVPDGAVEKALDRGSKVPGGWCGFYGDCGAAVGTGIAVSVITGGTPLTGKQRTLALGATSLALSRMLDDQPRCCKRAVRLAIGASVEYLQDKLGVALPGTPASRCLHNSRNRECPGKGCIFHG